MTTAFQDCKPQSEKKKQRSPELSPEKPSPGLIPPAFHLKEISSLSLGKEIYGWGRSTEDVPDV
jgi:hypothetical protein